MKKPSLIKVFIWTVTIAAYIYLVHRLIQFDYWNQFSFFDKPNSWWTYLLLFHLLLWGCNIGLETLKWQALLRPVVKVNFTHAFKMVLAGMTTGVITPARLGEPGGKLLLLKKEFRLAAGVATYLGGMLQTGVTTILGGISFLYVLGKPDLSIFKVGQLNDAITLLVILASTVVLIYFARKHVKRFAGSIRTAFSQVVSNGFPFEALIYTILRFIVFNIQLYFWLIFFNVNLTGALYFIISPIYFLLITVIPGFFLADLGIRGSVAIFVFSQLTNNITAIIAATFALWLFNVAIPVLLGSSIVLSHKEK
ncbi:hypothetical protein DMA11_20915 [Marinilabiliaceae bacterium JC017]|nr:hypothetical protein DMA11_20915 [Marinilabiliaceae bacterium JC017]